MEGTINKMLSFCLVLISFSCINTEEASSEKKEHIAEKNANKTIVDTDSVRQGLEKQGYQIFEYKDEEEDTIYLMQQYFIVFLKKGPDRSGSKAETDSLMTLHLAHLGRMYEEGYASISGPFGDDGDIRGITIYNTPTLEMADSLARMDPMVKSGRLIVETHPWWAAKGFPLR